MTREPIALTLPPGLLDEIATRVAALVLEQLDRPGSTESPWLDVAGACAHLRFSRDQLYKLTAAGAIPCHRKHGGRELRFHRDELDAWMHNHYPRVDRLA
jgi:excisionase family DNA binding protein